MYEYTFQNKNQKENKEKILRFDDPYMYGNSPPKELKKEEPEKVISKLKEYIKKNKGANSARILPYSEVINDLRGSAVSNSSRNSLNEENKTTRDKNISKKSFELLERLSTERDKRVAKLNLAHAQSRSEKFPHDILEELSNYKLKRVGSSRNHSRNDEKSTGINGSCLTMSGKESGHKMKSRNSTVRSYTEFVPANSRGSKNSEFVLFEIVKD